MDDAGDGRRGLRAATSPELLETLRAGWGVVPAPGEFDLGGSSNLNLLVTNGDERFVARVYRPYVTPGRLAAVQHARSELAESGLPCSSVVPTRGGRPWAAVGNRLLEVERHVERDAQMDDWDRLEAGLPILGRIHTVLRSVAVGTEGRSPLFANYIEPAEVLPATLRGAARIRAWGPTEEELQLAAGAAELARQLAALDVDAVAGLPRQLVHGDFWDDNVFFRKGRVVLVTDFDFMGERQRVDDLALTLYFALESLGDGSHSPDLHRLRDLVDAYDEGLDPPFSPQERERLPFAVARQPLWSIGDWIARLDDERTARRHAEGLTSAVTRGLEILDALDLWRDVLR